MKRLSVRSMFALTMVMVMIAGLATSAFAFSPKPTKPEGMGSMRIKVTPGSEADLFFQSQMAQIRKIEAKMGINSELGIRSPKAYDMFLWRVSKLDGVRIRDFAWDRRMMRRENMFNTRGPNGTYNTLPGQVQAPAAVPAKPAATATPVAPKPAVTTAPLVTEAPAITATMVPTGTLSTATPTPKP